MPDLAAASFWFVILASALITTTATGGGSKADPEVDCSDLNYDKVQNEAARTILLSLLMMQEGLYFSTAVSLLFKITVVHRPI